MLNRAYLAPAQQGRRQSLEMCRSVDLQKIDLLDHNILVRLVNGPFESLRGLARDLSEPFSTVERRVRRLRESGVIAGFLYSVDPDKLGIISYRLLVVTESINQSLESKLKSFALQNPHVIRFIQALGTFDFEFDVELRTAQQLPSLLQSLQAVGEGQIRDIHVMQELEDYKLSSYPLREPP